MRKILWGVQGLLAALFLFAGGMKLAMPIEMLTAQSHLPGLFLRFIGVCEVLGAVGLILPAALHIKERLTPLAAEGLIIIMVGAVVLSMSHGAAAAAVPFIVGILLGVIAWRFESASSNKEIRA